MRIFSDAEIPKTKGKGKANGKKNADAEPEKSTEPEKAAVEEVLKPDDTTVSQEEAIKIIEKQIDELVVLFEDPAASFDDKIRALINIPRILQFQNNSLLNRERCDRLFSCIPVELYQRVFEPKYQEYIYVRPVLIHILSFQCQFTSPQVNLKFKPLFENIMKAANPRENKNSMNSMAYNDIAIITCFWATARGEGKYVFDALRYETGYFVSQREKLDVAQFLLITRILLNKVFSVADPFDNRGWPVAILSIIRKLLREKTEKFDRNMRNIMWEIISAMTRLGGIEWFNMDKEFVKLAIQMNHVEMQMCLHNPESMNVIHFSTHLRILELYTTAICENEMFGEDGMEIIPHTVGDSTRYILQFWVECFLNKIPLHPQINLAIFNYTVFLFVHEELTLTDDKVKKSIGLVTLDTAIAVISEVTAPDLRGDTGQMFSDLIEKLSEFEQLDDRVPLLLIKYLNKIRGIESYEDWKGRVIDCKCCVMDLRGRVDWYSIKTLNEAKELLADFTEPEQHEIRHVLISIFDKLPRVK